jgi:hypothetical protein
LASSVDRCGYTAGLISHQRLAPLDKVFPLRTSAVYNLATTIHVVAYLFLALVNQAADLLGNLL